MSTLIAILLILLPLLIGLAALCIWIKYFQHRIGVTPVEEPMLRAPGESQRNRIEELHEDMLLPIMMALILPVGLAFVAWQKGTPVSDIDLFPWLLPFGMSAMIVGLSGRRLVKIFRELRNRRLGYAGECLVAERLQPLLKTDCLIFHDCPADKHGNIDHIVVTPRAIYAIETKTRRKKKDDERGDYESRVFFDGQSLIYPWGREDFGLDQSRRQARWLSELLTKALGEPVPVQPVLALPGWMVERTGRGDVSVVNPKQLPALIREPRTPPRPAALKRMSQIEFLLETRCRDVPFPGAIVAREAKKAAREAFLKRRKNASNAGPACAPKANPRQVTSSPEAIGALETGRPLQISRGSPENSLGPPAAVTL